MNHASERPGLSSDDARYAGLPTAEFGFPGPLRDRLVTAILEGSKTSTTGLLAAYRQEGEPLPVVGGREVVVDSAGGAVCVIEMTEVRVRPKSEVDLRFAIDEGEGATTVDEWWQAHVAFFESGDMREVLGDPDFTVDDSTELVLVRFRV
ncbi:MAG: ASCH domain-containing protein, partial [Candidatus Dormibacteraceae bacterium]